MTKNLIELSGLVLGKFRGVDGKPVSGRFSLPRDLDGEKAALRDLDFGSVWKSSSGIVVCDYRLDGAQYFALTLALPPEELADLTSTSEGSIEPTEVVGSIYLFLAHKVNLLPSESDPLLIEEHIAGPASTDEGVALDVVKAFLGDLTVFRVHDDSVFRGDVSSCYVANYICTFDARLSRCTRLNPVSMGIVREIFLQERYYLVERNLFEAISAHSARHAFLEVYRTLEFVFVLPRARSLLDALRSAGGSIDLNVLEFARHCNRELGWKRVERDAIGRIFQEFFETSRGSYESLVLACSPFRGLGPVPAMGATPNERATFVEKVAARYYQLRNQIAHQFWSDEELDCNDDDWSMLIEFSLRCIQYLYDRHLTAPVVTAEQPMEAL
ncbi:MAG: hypothetical protein EBZ48_09865 [Proteobacteria bacterium]|nr:hypothetical protein [Pseudomonadota bacterium]